MSLDDLEGPLRTLLQNTCVFGAHHENFQQRKTNTYTISDEDVAMSLVSRNISFVRIFAEVPWRGASNDSWVIENVDF